MSESNSSTKKLFLIVLGMIVAWGMYLIVGQFLFYDGKFEPGRGWLKGIILFVSFAIFLGIWGVALQLRARRLKAEREDVLPEKSEQSNSHQQG